MIDFTFIVITYNHEKYIVENLESIKTIIVKYQGNLDVDILISDDASNDNTVDIVNRWIDKNRGIFRNAYVFRHETNVGTVRNMFDAVNQCKTDNFKLIAGDDKYNEIDVFSVQKSVTDDEVLITPLTPFSNDMDQSVVKKTKTIREAFEIVYKNQSQIKKLERINNFIPAPGAFFGKNVLRDPELQKRVSRYRLIEDIPIWHYILFESSDYRIRINDKPECVCYRLGSGVTSNKKRNIVSEYGLELDRIRKDYGLKAFKYPKYINPYYIELLLIELNGKIRAFIRK